MSRKREGFADPAEILSVADRVTRALSEAQIPNVLIGAAAMAIHGYVKSTAGVDLATAVEPTSALARIARRLAEEGLDAEYIHPDPDDPLGGVIRTWVTAESTVDVVNFLNPYRAGVESLLRDGLANAPAAQEGSPLRVMPLTHLIGLKLYAGGPQSVADVAELIRINGVPEAELRSFLARFGLEERFDAVRAQLGDVL